MINYIYFNQSKSPKDIYQIILLAIEKPPYRTDKKEIKVYLFHIL